MKKTIIVLSACIYPFLLIARDDFEPLLNKLDKTIQTCHIYSAAKEKELQGIKDQLNICISDSLRYDIYNSLFNEYISYQSDSALRYAEEGLRVAEKLKDGLKITNSRLNLSQILAILGLYKEALEVVQEIDRGSINDLKERYFMVYRTIYRYMADYTKKHNGNRYLAQITAYRDSVLAMFLHDTLSPTYIMEKAEILKEEKKYDSALKMLLAYYPEIKSNMNRKAAFAYAISDIYMKKGNTDNEKYWLVISAINDLQSTNKEYISLRRLAFILYEEGDIQRAYRYIKRSSEDALFCNARLRTFEVSSILPVIHKAYQLQISNRQKQLVISLVCISFLSVLLVAAVIFIYRQMLKLAAVQKKLKIANEELLSINNQLMSMNRKLKESNFIKEEYVGMYMDQCSAYIDKMDSYRRLLYRFVAAGRNDELIKTIKPKDIIEEELKEFYYNFDSAFLQLFPTFITDFKKLLTDDQYVQLKQGQLLNTSLRIFALIRLGIKDTGKLSGFLRCSLSTIYNYQYKIKNNAICSKDEFEDRVMEIGL
ncbi:MAG: hypothetical protein JXB34_12160 [Bacteroidales bacterium]|nr:hypothetical protein [Bacteroidales bacterium]